jgi:hypothetical protein
MKSIIKTKSFDEILKDCQQACHHLNSGLDSEQREEYANLAREYKVPIDWVPLRRMFFYWKLKQLTFHLPSEIEKRLINIYSKLDDEKREKVKTLINGFFDQAKTNYENQMKALYASQGQYNWIQPKTLEQRINSDVSDYKHRAYLKVDDAINTKNAHYQMQRKSEYKMMITGFLLGIVASVIAGLILM